MGNVNLKFWQGNRMWDDRDENGCGDGNSSVASAYIGQYLNQIEMYLNGNGTLS